MRIWQQLIHSLTATNARQRVALLSLLSIIVFLSIPPTLMQDVSFSRAALDRSGKLLRLTTSQDEKFRLFVPLDHISPVLVQAVLLHEDKYFYDHPGINPIAIFHAALAHLTGGGRGGASTLTMQLARLKYGLHTRSITGKLWQMVQALRIELHYSKHDILEAYLNLAPYGANIEGVGAASHIYFAQNAASLSLPEALTLAVIPQSPARRTPGKNKTTDAALLQARQKLFTRWVTEHPKDTQYASLLSRPMHYASKHDLPFIAPQCTTRLMKSLPTGTVATTLDIGIQKQLEGIIHRYVAHEAEQGVANAAALLVDTRSMEVLASVGSADYFDLAHQGMVDGTRARRSPGSALKPFIYALAFDQGIIHPHSLMFDTPLTFSTYTPENFDRNYEGPLSAHDALIKSRNIPALWLAGQITHPDFYHFLQAAHIGKLRPEQSYGLSLALGSAEVTMEELAQLYAMLANDGELKQVRYTQQDTSGGSSYLLSPEASFMTLDIIKDTPPPGGSAVSDTLPLPVYWKTGTSGGLRDAWSVGVFGPYVLVVWVGDFHGSSHGQYVGIISAAPLFFDVMRAVTSREHPQDIIEAKPTRLHLAKTLVCSDTGDVNVPYCPAREHAWLIPGVSPIKPTGIYRRVLVNRDTGKLACRFVPNLTDYRVVQFWPSALTQVYAQAGITKTSPPAWEEGCEMAAGVHATTLRIISPAKATSYHIREGSTNQLPLKASFDGTNHTGFWFVGSTPVGTSTADKPIFWTLKRGRFLVRVIDESGNADSREITVD